jgi:prolipoprotein diacylglyceryl transferase
MLQYIHWNPDIELFSIGGVVAIRWYGLLFVSGLVIGYFIVKRLYEKEGLPTERLNSLAIYIAMGTIIGARLGHCLFYEPGYFLTHPLEMLLPVKIIDGSLKIVGYQGLASHGGAIGVALAIYLYCRKYKESYWFVLDKIAVATPLAGAFIRLGNLMNSEIIGTQTSVPWAFVFEKVDSLPRHPSQLYEAIAYFILFGLMCFLHARNAGKRKNGFLFGIFIFGLFFLRFVIEFVKISQETFEESLPLDMGQLLSIPFMIWGLVLILTKRH